MDNLLYELCALHGTSGDEGDVRDYIIGKIDGKCEWKTDKLGNIIAFKKGKKSPAHKIMIDAHMDEVGLIATYITDDGFIKFACVGGIRTESLIAQRVIFKNKTAGVIGLKPIHLLHDGEDKKMPSADNLYIDIGAKTKAEAEALVSLGDRAVFDTPFIKTGNSVISKAIDDRAGCAAIIKLIEGEPEYDFYATFTVMEEIGTVGAAAAAFSVAPDFAICLESTTASDIAGVADEKQVCLMGHGPVVSFMDRGTLYDRELYSAAIHSGIVCQTKTAVAGGNNAAAIHKSGSGVRTVAVSVPCRYIHSSASLADFEDIKNIKTLCEYMLSYIGGLK